MRQQKTDGGEEKETIAKGIQIQELVRNNRMKHMMQPNTANQSRTVRPTYHTITEENKSSV